GCATTYGRARDDGGAGPRLPLHGAAHRHHPQPGDLRHRAGGQSAGRCAARRARSKAANISKNEGEALMLTCLRSGMVALGMLSASLPSGAQTLNMMKGIDAPHYDAQRTSWGPTSDIVNMIQDTLVALDWDGKTPIPYLAKSWTVSPDGKLYTFKLRDDVSFCSGKKFTAADVVYTFKRLKDPAIKGPFAWRAGN